MGRTEPLAEDLVLPELPSDPEEAMGLDVHNAMVDKIERHAKKLDNDFYPPFPAALTARAFSKMSPKRRKSRFIMSFNASGGIVGIACRDAGIERADLAVWMKDDAEFKAKYEDTCLDVADRARFILHQRTGLIKDTRLNLEYKKISDHLLAFTVKNICPEIYGDKVSGTITLKIEVPRAVRPVDGDAPVLADAAANGLPHLPS